MLRLFLSLGLAVVGWGCSAQDTDWLLLSGSGDTLRGRVRYYFDAVNHQGQAVVPQQVHIRCPGERGERTYTALQVEAFAFKHRWAASGGEVLMEFAADTAFLEGRFFYECLPWRGADGGLVRSYELGAPPGKRHQWTLYHRYFWRHASGRFTALTEDNARPLLHEQLPEQTALLACIDKKRKLSLHSPYVGLSLCLDKALRDGQPKRRKRAI